MYVTLYTVNLNTANKFKHLWYLFLEIIKSINDGSLKLFTLNPIPTGLWSYVTNWGGAQSARISYKCYKTAKRLLSTQNLFPYKYFDL